MPGLLLPVFRTTEGNHSSILLVKLKPPYMIAPVLSCIEAICKPRFVITPYQVGSEDTLLIIVGKDDVGKALSAVRECCSVSSVEVLETIPAEIAFPLRTTEGRCVVYSEEVLTALFTGIYKYLPPDMSAAMLFHIGFYSGRSVGESITKHRKGRDPKDYLLSYLTRNFTIWGDGYIKLASATDNDSFIVIVADLIECSVQRRLGLSFGSHFYRGFFAGLASGALGYEHIAEEETCITKGDPFCVFRITSIR